MTSPPLDAEALEAAAEALADWEHAMSLNPEGAGQVVTAYLASLRERALTHDPVSGEVVSIRDWAVAARKLPYPPAAPSHTA